MRILVLTLMVLGGVSQGALGSSSSLLTDRTRHIEFLETAVRAATTKLEIVSPFLSVYTLIKPSSKPSKEKLIDLLKDAVKRGVDVCVYTDIKLDSFNGVLKRNSKDARDLLEKSGIPLRITNKVHAKIITVDDQFLAIGSFNWLSAVRTDNSHFANYEVTTLLQGYGIKNHISQAMAPLRTNGFTENQEIRKFYDSALPARQRDFEQAKGLLAEYATHHVFKPIALDILLGFISYSPERGAEVVQFVKETCEIDISEEVMNSFEGNIFGLEDYMDLARAFREINFEKTKALIECIADCVDVGQNVDNEAKELREYGFIEEARRLVFQAYHSPEASYSMG
jgi:hypothetical protein